jgi:dihydroxyacetone kinase-like protein
VRELVTREGVVAWLRAFAAAVTEKREVLTDLDSAIGDGDHGINMDRGMQAVLAGLDARGEVVDAAETTPGEVGALLKSVGMTLVSTVGGAAGPLYGTLFLEMGKCVAGESELGVARWAAALDAGVRGVRARGKAEPGDKTMVDALVPAAEALAAAGASGLSLEEALRQAASAAEQGMKATVPLVARKGRASYLGERSAGHQDPGATSSWLLMRAAAEALTAGTAPASAGT